MKHETIKYHHRVAPQKRLLNEEEAASYIGCSRIYLRKGRGGHLVGRYTPPPSHIKIGVRRIAYRIEDLDAWINQWPVVDPPRSLNDGLSDAK